LGRYKTKGPPKIMGHTAPLEGRKKGVPLAPQAGKTPPQILKRRDTLLEKNPPEKKPPQILPQKVVKRTSSRAPTFVPGTRGKKNGGTQKGEKKCCEKLKSLPKTPAKPKRKKGE